MQKIMIDGVDFRELMSWMNNPQEIDEEEYQKWRTARKSYVPKPRTDVYLRGNDFQSYMKCARRLWFNCHVPELKKSMITKSIFGAVKRHEEIEKHLKEKGWKTEFFCKGDVQVGERKIYGTGHIDGLSPSNTILDIKGKWQPSDGDKLQTAFYQLLLRPLSTDIVLLYPTQINYFGNFEKLIRMYIPRVYACVALDVKPPRHPSYPNCYYNCEYYKECGRSRKPPKKLPHLEWNDWFKETGALIAGEQK